MIKCSFETVVYLALLGESVKGGILLDALYPELIKRDYVRIEAREVVDVLELYYTRAIARYF